MAITEVHRSRAELAPVQNVKSNEDVVVELFLSPDFGSVRPGSGGAGNRDSRLEELFRALERVGLVPGRVVRSPATRKVRGSRRSARTFHVRAVRFLRHHHHVVLAPPVDSPEPSRGPAVLPPYRNVPLAERPPFERGPEPHRPF